MSELRTASRPASLEDRRVQLFESKQHAAGGGGGGNGLHVLSGALHHHQYLPPPGSSSQPGRNGSSTSLPPSTALLSGADLGASPGRKRHSSATEPSSTVHLGTGTSGSTAARSSVDTQQQQSVSDDVVPAKRPRGVSHDDGAVSGDGDAMSDVLTKDEHRLLVAAVYEIGLKHASPAVIFEHMTEPHQEVTGERLKSHLQKYRKNKDKSREEFLHEYDAWMEKALTVGCAGGTGRFLAPPKAIAEIVGSKKLLGGDLPAFLSYSMLQEQNTAAYPVYGSGKSSQAPTIDTRRKSTKGGASSSEQHQVLSFPILTEEERKSPLGTCISQVIGLFYPMAKYLMSEREKSETSEVSPQPIQARRPEDHPSSYSKAPIARFVERNYAGRPERQQPPNHQHPYPPSKPSTSHNFSSSTTTSSSSSSSSSQVRVSFPNGTSHQQPHYPYSANTNTQQRSSNGRHPHAPWLHEV